MNDEASEGGSAFRNHTRPHFDEALARCFPAFLTAIAESTPINATPYLAGYEEFRQLAAGWPGRAELLEALDNVRATSTQYGVTVEALLVGGSFHDLATAAPRDVDCLMFYRRAAPGEPVDAVGLTNLRKQAKGHRVDVRFLPIDADPIVLIKSLCYFTTLYCQIKPADDREEVRAPRGLLLLDCRP